MADDVESDVKPEQTNKHINMGCFDTKTYSVKGDLMSKILHMLLLICSFLKNINWCKSSFDEYSSTFRYLFSYLTQV